MMSRLAGPLGSAVRAFGVADASAALRLNVAFWPARMSSILKQHAPTITTFRLGGGSKSMSTDQTRSSKLDESEGLPHMHPGMKRSLLGAHNVQHEPIYEAQELEQISPAHRNAQGIRDYLALALVRSMRTGFDVVTGYKTDRPMTLPHWLRRVIFLETVAGVPGMVGGMLRHLRSLRSMDRDHGWIYTLLEEAENERMHLMTFLEVREAPMYLRGLVALGQGVFFNLFFVSYLLSPNTCHRFVGYLEEEAVKTYTHLLHDIDTEGTEVHGWNVQPAPLLAINYWQMEPTATMRDVVLVIRADEACHSHVNHAFGTLPPNAANPFRPDCMGPDGHHPPPTMDILKPVKEDFTRLPEKVRPVFPDSK
mmetsp:Transcript_13996/g.29902  ORF Transcript_13996/g.29902 Transcript_13996/m.29902 type:complete len:366 (-) Transcript_13996:255-1352(-)